MICKRRELNNKISLNVNQSRFTFTNAPGPAAAAPRAARAHRVTAHDSVRQFSSADSSGVLTHRTGHRAGHRTGPPHGTAARAALVCAHRLTRHTSQSPRSTSDVTAHTGEGAGTGDRIGR